MTIACMKIAAGVKLFSDLLVLPAGAPLYKKQFPVAVSLEFVVLNSGS
jgi:hypothetical protein